MSIRTATLAVGDTGTAGGGFLLYTVPDEHHVRLRRSLFRVLDAASLVVLFTQRPGVAAVTFIEYTPAAIPNTVKDEGDTVLEAGDEIRAFLVAGTRVRYWLSGTLYTD